MPTHYHAGVNSVTAHYLRAVQDVGSPDDALAVVAAMRRLPIDDFFARNATLRPDGRMVHDMYLFRVKRPDQSRGEWDLYERVATVPGDQAFRPMIPGSVPDRPDLTEADPPAPHACDVLVIGSGAGGMAAAATASLLGLSVLVVEKEPWLGGTTALSGGGLWVPGNPLAQAAGVTDSSDEVRRYLRHEAGNHLDPAVLDAFLQHGPAMIGFFQERTEVRFASAAAFPDYHPDAPGAAVGRTLLTKPYDGRRLGPALARLRRPLRQMTLAGMTLASGDELWHFLRATRSARSAAYVGRVMLRYGVDLLRSGRGTRLTNGNALAARLLATLLRRGVPIWDGAPARSLVVRDGRVCGAVVERAGHAVHVSARRGVVLACGGFPHDPTLRAHLFPHAQGGHHSPAPRGNTGDGIRLGAGQGGALRTDLLHAAAWAPVSLIPRPDGGSDVFPHLVDRQKPGLIAVDARGRRFANEAASYHDFVAALVASTPPTEEAFAWLLADRRAIRRYGLGFAKPFPLPAARRAALRLPAAGAGPSTPWPQPSASRPWCSRTRWPGSTSMRTGGEDTAFGRGGTSYNRFMGDPTHGPNPCLAPLLHPPFYAVRMVVGDLGTFAGLRTDGNARVLDAAGAPIDGLYAAGNDMANPLGGAYPGGGATLGPAMTFGYVAARHMAGVA